MAGSAGPPFTEICTKLAGAGTLVALVDQMTAKNSRLVDNRATALSLTIMGAAGDFINGLHWGERATWRGSDDYLRDTNMDAIAAEAVVWVAFLVSRLWNADQKADHEMFERVGYVTVNMASRLALSMIEDQTGIDYARQAAERRKVYFRAETENARPMFECFASVLLDSIGRRSLAEPLRRIGPLPPPEWTPLSAYVAIFCSTMPKGFYETFKRMLIAWPDRFPEDEEE